MRISDWSSDVCSSDLAATASIYKTASARATKDKAALTALAAKAGGASEAADAYLAWGDYARAAELYRAALKQTPADPGQVNTRLGIALARAGNVEEARKALAAVTGPWSDVRSEEHTSELQSLMRISYAVFCLKNTNKQQNIQ